MGRYAAPPFNRVIEAPALMPPKLPELGHQPFTRHELELLALLMGEPAWPRATMNVYALEGYLTALLAWPVELHPGVWLPAIWNEASWRVRPPIDTVQRYGAFVELIVGFLRSIDRGLMQTPATFESCLRWPLGHDPMDIKARAGHWRQGFGRALRQGTDARATPSEDAREAVRHIAARAAGQCHFPRGGTQQTDFVLNDAVLVLASTRVSRGPLGALPTQPRAASHKAGSPGWKSASQE
jgi:yecA family protein